RTARQFAATQQNVSNCANDRLSSLLNGKPLASFRYDQLHTVDLSNNNISTIHGKAFHNMKSVRFLSLNDNNLTIANPGTDYEAGEEESLHPRMLSPLKNLEKLHLKNAFDHRRKKHG